MASEILAEYEVSITRACRLMDIHRSYYYYTSGKDDADVEDAIRDVGRFGEGFWKIFKIIRRQGHTWNHKNLYRVYKSLHFEKRSRLT